MDAMRTDRSCRRSAPFAVMLAVGLAGTGACGVEEPLEEEPIEVVTSAFSESSCAIATADAAMTHPLIWGGNDEMSVTSPTSYNTCYKGYVADVWHNETNLGFPPAGWTKQVTVKWAGPIATTRAGCEALTGSAYVYEYDDFENPVWAYPEHKSTAGTWLRYPGLPSFCSPPVITFSIQGRNRMTYPWPPRIAHRVAATMRSGTTTAPVKISVKTTVFNAGF